MPHRQAQPLVELHDPHPAQERRLPRAHLRHCRVGARGRRARRQPEQQVGPAAHVTRDARRGLAAHLAVVPGDLDVHEVELASLPEAECYGTGDGSGPSSATMALPSRVCSLSRFSGGRARTPRAKRARTLTSSLTERSSRPVRMRS